ncbi:putative nucleotide-diphospho-sugar transferase [Paracoccaceae bacterium GXU_MW_L88]
MPASTDPRDGFVFGATGQKYVNLARRAARNLRAMNPDKAIDLFTDREVDDPIFDKVHQVEINNTRPKMEAILKSRFERTVYLDCDVIAVAPAPELFEILDRFEFAGCFEQYGNAPITFMDAAKDIPISFRQINGGVLCVRRTERSTEFFKTWQRRFIKEKRDYDQPLLREMLYYGDLNYTVLPSEYNLMHLPYMANSSHRMLAPRFLHITRLHSNDEWSQTPEEPFDPQDLMGGPAFAGMNARIEGDRSLGGKTSLRDRAGVNIRKLPGGKKIAKKFSGKFGFIK